MVAESSISSLASAGKLTTIVAGAGTATSSFSVALGAGTFSGPFPGIALGGGTGAGAPPWQPPWQAAQTPGAWHTSTPPWQPYTASPHTVRYITPTTYTPSIHPH